MTVSSEINKVTYAGDGATAAFSTGFAFGADDEVVVTLVASDGTETEWTRGTQYTLTGAGTGSAGTVTVATSPTDYTPANGTTLVVRLRPAYLQETALPRGGTVPPKTLETMHDTRVRQLLRLKDDIDRALRIPIAETTIAALPAQSVRADKVFGFDASGDPVALTVNDQAYLSISAFVETLLDDADAAAARATLGAEAADGDILKADLSDTLTAGFASAVEALGDSGSGTVTLEIADAKENLKTLTVTGSFTLAPQAADSVVALIATNDATGGHAITTSGYDFVHPPGGYNDAANAKHLLRSTVIGGTRILEILEIA